MVLMALLTTIAVAPALRLLGIRQRASIGPEVVE
jgi:hypothetical protein